VPISVVIVAYRAGPALLRCLESLSGQEGLIETIVVDNGDGGSEIEQARASGSVRVLSPNENLGFAAGANLGAAESSGDVIAFLNPDTVVAAGALRSLAERASEPGVGIATARLLLLDRPELLNSSGTEVHVSGIGWAGGFEEPADSVSTVRDVPAPSGAAMAMRSETFHELGGFAEEFFMYLEDLELGWRARIAGYRVVVDPAADVLHEYEFGRNPRKNYFLERNRLAFVLSAYSARLLVLLGPLLLATELGMVLLAAKEGWAGDKLAGWSWLVRNAGQVGRRRGATQRLRKVRDRDLSRYLTPVFDPRMIPIPGLLGAANPVVERYWSLVRRAL
jgi:GT2 family glycosyltransferase